MDSFFHEFSLDSFIETYSVLLTLGNPNPEVTGGFPSQEAL